MDYEKKYKEALANARQEYNTIENVERKQWLEEIFPELKESEDERIKNEIIKFLELPHPQFVGKRHQEKWIAWLEKQGNTSKKVTCTQEVEVGNGNIKALITKDYNSIDSHFAKPIDNVKPKFHEGEWITNGDYTWRIIAVEPLDYILQSQDGNIVEDTISYVDEYFHLWTIQDAKDGDVLATEAGGVFIYKELLYDKPFAYCGVDKFGIFKDCNCGAGLDWTPYLSDVTPATKEQRDLLFQKMKEAGWEWNTEKKELKKIELIDEYEGLTDFERILADICVGWIGEEPGWKQYIKDNADVLIKIAFEKFNSVQNTSFEQMEVFINKLSKQFPDVSFAKLSRIAVRVAKWAKPADKEMKELLRTEYEKGRADAIAEIQNPAWSEEDECYMAECINAIATKNGWSFEEKRKTKHWLESLKQKIADAIAEMKKPTWNGEDDYNVQCLVAKVNSDIQKGYIGRNQELIDWLESLKDRV